MSDQYSSDDGELVQNLQKVVITHLRKRGTREQVWNGEAHSTSGGLTRQDLMISNTGKIVSKKASEKSKQLMLDRHQSKKDVQTTDDQKPSASKNKKSTKVEEVSKPKKAPSAVKPKKPSKKKNDDVSESDE
jgi:hypothetical protein